MCLGVPGKIARWIDRAPLTAQAELDFEGIRRVCQMACVTEAEVGDYVLVHAGLAITRIDSEAAEELLRTLRSLGQDTEAGQESKQEENSQPEKSA